MTFQCQVKLIVSISGKLRSNYSFSFVRGADSFLPKRFQPNPTLKISHQEKDIQSISVFVRLMYTA